MRILLLSTYELGHQPLHVASPAARLRAAGHDIRALDLGVEEWDDERAAWAEAVAVSVPMHTAMRLAVASAERLRASRPDLPICFYGLYAPVARELTEGLADRVIAGEYERELVQWVAQLAPGGAVEADTSTGSSTVVQLGRGREEFLLPARDVLPGLEQYAKLRWRGRERVAGYVEATHGCAHRCRHCPVPTVYDGKFRVVSVESIVADVERLVEAGAEHLSFGDPDFLNGPTHALAVARAVHERFPDLTWDATVKVEHILAHPKLWSTFVELGLLFVIAAFETTDDAQLEILDKGHTVADMRAAVALLRQHGIAVRPSWMPFTPWSSVACIADIFDFTLEQGLVAHTDAVQFSIRLLLPDGSLLLDHPALTPYLGEYDSARLSWTWTHPDAEVDALQRRLAAVAERLADRPAAEVFAEMAREVYPAAGRQPPTDEQIAAATDPDAPGLTEPWFCCAEPTEGQLTVVSRTPDVIGLGKPTWLP